MPDNSISSCPLTDGSAPPFSGLNWTQVKKTTLLFCGRKLSIAQQRKIIQALDSWPEPAIQRLSASGFIQVIVLSGTEFSRRFPESFQQDASAAWESGKLFIGQTKKLDEGAASYEFFLDPVRFSIEGHLYKERKSPPRSAQLLPRDFRSGTRFLKQFIAHGFQMPLGPLLSADLGLAEAADDTGKSAHQLRLRFTNPVFNRWVDPSVAFYLGFYAMAATKPFGAVGIASWGVDSRLTVFSKLDLYLDTNLQYRVHSSGAVSSDEFAVEATPRLSSQDKKFSIGVSFTTVLYPNQEIRGSLVGTLAF